MPMFAGEIGVFKNITASGNVKSTQGSLMGYHVNSTTAGTIQFYDDPATGTATPMSGLITPGLGFNRFPAAFATGLNAVVGGTLNITLFYV